MGNHIPTTIDGWKKSKRRKLLKKTTNERSGLPKDPKTGKAKGGPGRPKGVPNKVTGEAKRMIALAFEGVGGLEQLIEWAKDHQTAFYTQVYAKLIPLQVQGEINANIKDGDGKLLAASLEHAFHRIIDAQSEQKQFTDKSGDNKTPLLIEARAIRSTEPR